MSIIFTEYMWNAVKEPFDSPATFDRDGLELAFKYFTCSTLTMRLAGINQINSYIGVFNDLCNNENMAEAETVGQNLAEWLISVNIISHIFGPNLHVEVFKFKLVCQITLGCYFPFRLLNKAL